MNIAKFLNTYVGYLLALVIVVYIMTGLAYAGSFGIDSVINPATANYLHSNNYLLALMIVLLALHGGGKYVLRLKKKSTSSGEEKA